MNTLLKYTGYIFLVSLFAGCASSMEMPEKATEYAASPIYSLDKNINAVVKEHNVRLKINSDNNAIYTVKKVITVQQPQAREHGRLVLQYGEFQDIQDVEGALYSRNGTLIRKLGKNDGMDISMSDGYSIYQDSRIKTYQLYHDRYPYTVVYNYSIKFSGLLNLPAFTPQGPDQFVENARLRVETPADLALRYHTENIDTEPLKSRVEGDSVFVWELKSLSRIPNESFDPIFLEKMPRVMLATEQFKMGESTGQLSSWNKFGEWYYSLSEGRQKLPAHVQEEVRTIYNRASNREEGIKALYEYMQNKTRYVSIQLGIGGWQPFEAGFVEQKGYGDCKALTNYMQSILQYAGIDSYPVLIRNGIYEPRLIRTFPSNQFNHVILYVPGDEPIWLESTSQFMPFNYIGTGNAGRYGLLIKSDSSRLIKTPTYDYSINHLENEITIDLDDQGDADIDMEISYSGAYLDEILAKTAQKSDKEREKWLYETLSLTAFQLYGMDFTDIDKKSQTPRIRAKLSSRKFANRTGSRLFVPLNKVNKWNYRFPEMNKQRTQPVEFPFSFEETDNILVRFDEDLKVEALPKDMSMETSFGLFKMTVKNIQPGVLEIHRSLRITQKRIEAEKYEELRAFFVQIADHDNKNIVLRSM